MEFLAGLGWYTIPFIVVLSLLVFVHELGHFLVARYNGVGVDVFSIGFGPEIFGWTDSKGTRWKFSWLPLGGYVQMVGDADPASSPDFEAAQAMDEESKSRSLHHKSVWQRIAVSGAGPLANYLLAIVILSFLYTTMGQRFTAPIVEAVKPGSVAEKAGLLPGDRFVEVEGSPVERFEDVQMVVNTNPDKPLEFKIARGEKVIDMTITPELSVIKTLVGETKAGLLGVVGQQSGLVKRPWYSSVWYATYTCFDMSWKTIQALYEIIIGARSADGLGGPLRIAQMSGDVAQHGIMALMWFAAILSINLGLINLFPIPGLDGGHLLLYFIEAVKGKPISQKAQEWSFRIGISVLVALMVAATVNDLFEIIFK